jgi:hypothetical protein
MTLGRTAILRRTPLSRGDKPLQTRTELRNHTPINPVSAKRAVQNRQRVLTERDLGRVKGGMGECARCRQYGYVNGHERRKRSQGGDPARPDCLLCIPCNGWASENMRIACWTGWAVSPKYAHDPALQNGQALDIDGAVVTFARAADLAEDEVVSA